MYEGKNVPGARTPANKGFQLKKLNDSLSSLFVNCIDMCVDYRYDSKQYSVWFRWMSVNEQVIGICNRRVKDLD